MITDIIDRPINVGDAVVFTNSLYRVVSLSVRVHNGGRGMVRILLWHPSKTTRPVTKDSKSMCVIPAEDMTVWKLKNGN